jgi:hypothetical protein
MLHAWPENMDISAYHGLHRKPYDFLSHPMAPCGTLLVAHDSVCEKWDNYGRIGFYLGPAVTHYRSYHCFIADINATRICDSVMFYPAPLVMPGASHFDQLLQLTERLVAAIESQPPEPNAQPLYTECPQKLKDLLLADVTNAAGLASSHITVCAHTPPPKHRHWHRPRRIHIHGSRVRVVQSSCSIDLCGRKQHSVEHPRIHIFYASQRNTVLQSQQGQSMD